MYILVVSCLLFVFTDSMIAVHCRCVTTAVFLELYTSTFLHFYRRQLVELHFLFIYNWSKTKIQSVLDPHLWATMSQLQATR